MSISLRPRPGLRSSRFRLDQTGVEEAAERGEELAAAGAQLLGGEPGEVGGLLRFPQARLAVEPRAADEEGDVVPPDLGHRVVGEAEPGRRPHYEAGLLERLAHRGVLR